MVSFKKLNLIILLVMGLSLVLAACSNQDALPETGQDVPPEVVIEAQRVLSQDLNLDVQNIQIQQTEQMDWPNACLGLPNEGETCAQVVTPGWRAVVEANGTRYELRTDDTGDIIRWQQLD